MLAVRRRGAALREEPLTEQESRATFAALAARAEATIKCRR